MFFDKSRYSIFVFSLLITVCFFNKISLSADEYGLNDDIMYKDNIYQNKKNYIQENKYTALITAKYEILNVKMDELLYDTTGAYKVSELNYVHKNVSLFTLGFEFTPVEKFVIGAVGSFSFHRGKIKFDDYDWIDDNGNLTTKYSRHSWHQNGKFNYTLLDVYLKYTLFHFGYLNDKGVLIGYFGVGAQYRNTNLEIIGGSYWYNNGATTGSFDDVTMHKYVQKSILPYWMFTLKYHYKNFEAFFVFKHSAFNRFKAKDIHVARGFSNTFKYGNVFYYNIVMNAGYWINKNVKFFIECQVFNTKGKAQKLEIRDENDNVAKQYIKNSNFGYLFSLGATFGF